jgi:predicted nucleic acid-binding protein
VSFVVDASLTLAWYFEDEATPATEALLDRLAMNGAVVPALWRLEVGNGFQMAFRRKRIDKAYRDTALTELAAMPITIDAETDTHAWTTTLRLSERFTLSLYDAAYLELAQRRDLPLASLDKQLRAAGHALSVPLLGQVAP